MGFTTKGNGVRQRIIKRQDVTVGPVAIKFITIFVLALLTLIYLIQSTRGATQQLKLTGLEEHKKELQNERSEIELEAIRLKSLQNLKDKAKNFKLEPVTETENMTND